MIRVVVLLVGVISSCSVSSNAEENGTWNLGWFPNKPGESDPHQMLELSDKNLSDKKSPTVNEDIKNDTWHGNWFPNKPGETDKNEHILVGTPEPTLNDTWKGNWFPNKPNEADVHPSVELAEKTKTIDDAWNDKWFPNKPGQADKNEVVELNADSSKKKPTPAGQTSTSDEMCDDGMQHIEIDFDPKNITHLESYICQEDREFYRPRYSTNPEIFEQTLPSRYIGAVRCVDTPIHYEGIPMYGPHRPIAPRYGEYVYVPPQRWLNSMAAGAIVMLYHPCADPSQVDRLKNLVTQCLRRHIISASSLPTADRSLVLVAWGNRLEMSAVAQSVVVDFIRKHALRGVPVTQRRPARAHRLYEHMLLKAADVVSNEADSELCPNLV